MADVTPKRRSSTGLPSRRALGLVIDRGSGSYVGQLPPEKVADALAQEARTTGSRVEHLRGTVRHFAASGIRDGRLRRLPG
jgi:cation transport regulator ChaC